MARQACACSRLRWGVVIALFLIVDLVGSLRQGVCRCAAVGLCFVGALTDTCHSTVCSRARKGGTTYNIVLVSLPLLDNFLPLRRLAEELGRRGHTVTLASTQVGTDQQRSSSTTHLFSLFGFVLLLLLLSLWLP